MEQLYIALRDNDDDSPFHGKQYALQGAHDLRKYMEGGYKCYLVTEMKEVDSTETLVMLKEEMSDTYG
jgi:hypothetical protein